MTEAENIVPHADPDAPPPHPSRLRRFLVGPERPGTFWADLGLLFLRAFAGLSLAIAHGIGKVPVSDRFIANVENMGFPQPRFFAWSAALAELAGGILIFLGFFTRPAAFFVLCTMSVAAFITHQDDPYIASKMSEARGKELALVYAIIAVFLMLRGSGRLSLDSAMLARTDEQKLSRGEWSILLGLFGAAVHFALAALLKKLDPSHDTAAWMVHILKFIGPVIMLGAAALGISDIKRDRRAGIIILILGIAGALLAIWFRNHIFGR